MLIFVVHGRACKGAGNPVENVAGARGASLVEVKQKNPSRPDGANSPGSRNERRNKARPDKFLMPVKEGSI